MEVWECERTYIGWMGKRSKWMERRKSTTKATNIRDTKEKQWLDRGIE